jgi:hypothetical protein
VIVAALLAFDGIAIAYSGILLPDNLLSLLFVGCAILVYQALVTDPRRAGTYMLGAGLAAGLAYSTKDTGILLLVPVIALVATSPSARPVGRQIRLGGVFVGAFVAVWVLEGLFYLIRAGDFLYKVHAIAAVHNAAIAPAANLLDFARHGYWNLASTLDSVWLTLVPLVVGLACWTILIVRRHDTAIFAAIGVFTSGFLFFGTSSLTHLVNLPYQERYFDPMLPFVAIAFAVVLGQAMAARPRRWRETVVAFIALATLVGGTFGAAARSGTLYFTEGLRNAAIAVAALPKDGLPVFAHEHARDGLAQYLPSSLASRVVQTGIGDGGDGVGYYLVILRDGVPLWPDSIFSARDQRSIRLTVSLSQRRVDAWNPVARRRARDSVIVYDLGRR